jgi:radical SAM protein with 4Fe4S-binding SPASM domain
VIDGIRILNDVKKQRHSPTPAIRFNYVVSQQNYREIAETIELAQKLGVQAIYFQPLDLFGLEDRHTDLVGDLSADALSYEIRRALRVEHTLRKTQHTQVQTNLQDFLRRLPDYWGKYQMQLQRQRQCGVHDLLRSRLFKTCLLPWFSAYITVNGDMRPCCTCWQSDTSMGNLFDMPVEAVWNGERYQQLRQIFREGNRPFPVCKTCVPKTLTSLLRYATLLPRFVKMLK